MVWSVLEDNYRYPTSSVTQTTICDQWYGTGTATVISMSQQATAMSDDVASGRKRVRSGSPASDECIPLSKRINCLTINEPDLLMRYPYMPQMDHPYYEDNKKLYFLYLERMARNNRHHPY